MLSNPLEAERNILGYTLKERIGSGGFGEVWSAVAPGGLMKAVKIVYGFHDEKRAQTELKALDRVKGLRHPFLLSLERIEIHEGQLVVVTELADNSLANLFNEYAATGEVGVPRDELVRYIRSAADALDYMSDQHKLQHLDVKPENLLMVSGHVKVADFGLIKDLQNASQSLMSGMTPAYAAPELFDGRPGMNSDQYSLAIVYQEMLTGVRPFPGSTPAQLTAQHMHGKPNLRPLPKSDQPIIAKALSKDPAARYKSCRDMAKELGNKKRSARKAIRRSTIMRTNTGSDINTIDFTEQREVTAIISGDGLPFQASKLKTLAPPKCEGSRDSLRPTLIIGIGSTANRVVEKLKSQWTLRHGPMENAPAIKMLCVDADRQAMARLRMNHSEGSLLSDELLETPLRKAEGYRVQSASYLNWLSRRWIYNVPRSLQTEGLRPLGRLAFADHFESICERLQSGLTQIVKEENLAKTADLFDLSPGKLQPRVFVLTSISGGVGSGMAIDLAYTVKLLMHENGMETDDVIGILMHSTSQHERDRGLSAANALAFFTEMRHFVECGFPGDNTIGLPEFDDEPPFDFTYFNDLGDDQSQSDFDDKLAGISEYLYLSTTSKCSEFFDKCRDLESEFEHLALRTFGVSLSNQTADPALINQVGQGLLRRWTQRDSSEKLNFQSFTGNCFAHLGLTQDKVIESIDNWSLRALDGTFEPIVAGARGISASGVLNLVAYLDGALGCPPFRRDAGHSDPEVCLLMEEMISEHGIVTGGRLSQVIQELIDGSELKLRDAKLAADQGLRQIASLTQQLGWKTSQLVEKLNQQIRAMSAAGQDSDAAREIPIALVDEYCQMRVSEFSLRFARVYYREINKSLGNVGDLIKRFESQINVVSREFDAADEIEGTNELPEFEALLRESIAENLVDHIAKSEVQVFESIAKERGGFLTMLREPTIWNEPLAKEIRHSIQKVLSDAFKKVSLENIIVKNNVGPERLVKWINQKISEARPRLSTCGGNSRLMVGLPALSSDSIIPDLLEKQFNIQGCPISGTSGNFVLCFEAEDVSFANVAFRLLETRPDAIELVKRIQTRKDIDWRTLDDLL
ncbi:MAG: tubulin-like doman-containing protein [Mariniblastus sp.]|nr:tubulin-like doman-containing protein [Mariniblastus sp.]